MRHRGIDEIAAGGMDDTLRLPGRAGRVKDEQRVLGAHRARRAIGGRGGHQRLDVNIAALNPGGLLAGVFHHKAAHLVRAVQKRRIGVGFQRGTFAAAGRGIGGDDKFRAAVVDTVGQRVGREAGEHDRMHGADAGAGKHGISSLGDHRHVDHDAVAAHHALAQQHVRHAVDVFVQLFVGDVLRRGLGIIGFKDDRGLVATGGKVTVDAVGRNVEDAILEPFDVDLAEFKRGVFHLGERLDPVDALAMFRPEGVRRVDRGRVHFRVARRIDMRICNEFRRRRVCGDLSVIRHGCSSLGCSAVHTTTYPRLRAARKASASHDGTVTQSSIFL
ncbi:hypothetical protein GALL_475400 [mine drainage metagenome]|uniref:Uncharacterized protein n=1 Tax=mine drainage metagenome TaxID=410659 RepID=A0A1J5PHB5_9ZZZZ